MHSCDGKAEFWKLKQQPSLPFLVLSGFCQFGLFFSWVGDRAPTLLSSCLVWALLSAWVVLCVERGVRILAFRSSLVSVLCWDSDIHAVNDVCVCILLWALTTSNPHTSVGRAWRRRESRRRHGNIRKVVQNKCAQQRSRASEAN